MTIRNETPHDERIVEELTKKAFWNVNVPGCSEHYLAHVLRKHPDFVPELNLVLEEDGCIIANVMYTKSKLIGETGAEKQILTFGPLSVLPEFQRKGYGKMLLEESFRRAVALGFDAIVIFGNPENYASRGFKSCKKYNVCIANGLFPTAMLVKELQEGALQGQSWTYVESNAYEIDESEAEEFDRDFPPLPKEYRASQELFYLYSHSQVL